MKEIPGKHEQVHLPLRCNSNNYENTINHSDNGAILYMLIAFAQGFKAGYLDFSHLTEFKNIYITEIYMKKQYKSSIIKNHEIVNKNVFDGVPLKGYVAS